MFYFVYQTPVKDWLRQETNKMKGLKDNLEPPSLSLKYPIPI